MNPLQQAVLDKFLEVAQRIEREKVVKEMAEKLEGFSNGNIFKDKKLVNIDKAFKEQTDLTGSFSRIISSNAVGQFKKVDGGYESEVVLFEDGYILNRIVIEKGANEEASKRFKKNKKALLVNDTHIQIEDSLLLGNLGAITKMRTEKFGENEDRTRTFATFFLDERNPVVRWLVDFGNDMNNLLKKEGIDLNIYSVSSEIKFNNFEWRVFANSFVGYTSDFDFTGMGICFDPAVLECFGSVDSLSKNKNIFNILENSEMAKKKKEEKLSEEEVVETTETETEEVENESESESEVVMQQEEQGKEEQEEEKQEEEKEKEEEEEKEEKEEEKEEVTEEQDNSKVKELEAKVEALTSIAEKSLRISEESAKTLEEYKKTIDSLGGEVLSRTPKKPESNQLSKAQQASKLGNKSGY